MKVYGYMPNWTVQTDEIPSAIIPYDLTPFLIPRPGVLARILVVKKRIFEISFKRNQKKDRANEDLAYVIAICSLGIGGITGNVLILKRKLFQTKIKYDFND